MSFINYIANNQVRAGQYGAIEVILDVMKTHISNADICKQGCGALRNITVNGKSSQISGDMNEFHKPHR